MLPHLVHGHRHIPSIDLSGLMLELLLRCGAYIKSLCSYFMLILCILKITPFLYFEIFLESQVCKLQLYH